MIPSIPLYPPYPFPSAPPLLSAQHADRPVTAALQDDLIAVCAPSMASIYTWLPEKRRLTEFRTFEGTLFHVFAVTLWRDDTSSSVCMACRCALPLHT